MAKLSLLEVAAVAYEAGFRGNAGGIAVAVSTAENQPHDSTATSHNPDGGTNVGLWQIDTKSVPGSSQYVPMG